MALGKEGVAVPLAKSTDERVQKIRAHVQKIFQKLSVRHAEAAKKS